MSEGRWKVKKSSQVEFITTKDKDVPYRKQSCQLPGTGWEKLKKNVSELSRREENEKLVEIAQI